MSEDKVSQEEAYKWISPIMHFGNKIEQEIIDNSGEMNSVESLRTALHNALTKEERAIYFSESLSSQCNLSGLNLFFNYSIGVDYYDVVEALREIGCEDMIQALEACKNIVFGDDDVPINDFEKMDKIVYADGAEERAESLEKIAKGTEGRGGIQELFEKRQLEYVMECVERGALTKKYD